MSKLIVFCLCLSFIVLVYSAPAPEILDEDLVEENVEHSRVKRFTCDVLSVEAKGVKLNHSACAVHCLFKKRSGGYCNKKRVCICR